MLISFSRWQSILKMEMTVSCSEWFRFDKIGEIWKKIFFREKYAAFKKVLNIHKIRNLPSYKTIQNQPIKNYSKNQLFLNFIQTKRELRT